jgi:hypothetical protein
VAVWVLPVKPGDRYLLCSDGLTDAVDLPEVNAALVEEAEPADCADRLISATLAAGAPDNVTVIVADVLSHRPRFWRRLLPWWLGLSGSCPMRSLASRRRAPRLARTTGLAERRAAAADIVLW